MSTVGEQLPLPFALRERSTFERFVAGANQELVARLRQRHAAFDCLWLFGGVGVGKTHLLHAMCHRHPHSAYVPAGKIEASASSLDGYGEFNAVAIDDAPRWLGERDAELAVIGLYNRLAAQGARLVLSADRSPLAVDFALPDLGSRLCAAACYRVAPLADADKERLLVDAARERGLHLADDVARFLLARASRDLRQLLRLLDRLDRSSLVAQRRITIPFVKEVLCL